ncbi:3-methyl-2-oxobutanoate hydroxymethyltransferase [Frankia sp. AiPs1]|uniref:3-methyl-2-oxobutanoate hydroxymethyltransferase n=1 Tax=Frankia sp. AiPa1 TaxID=573492 RepID=UPI00202B7D14|nr:3-methyl-2-oxobutanoate hydroxymethyltransferase [Frankia sp. AiPa1]MCL9759600.1 3-methyl-2-oxobutanoate hydroxymethyltransferase [Frankia sp. AiPa1]
MISSGSASHASASSESASHESPDQSHETAAATLYGAPAAAGRPHLRPRTRFTVRDVAAAKARGARWAMLTAYDFTSASVFDEAEIPVLLVGDSAANVVYGYDTTIPVTVDELIPLVRAVVRGAPHAMVVADLPFGSYQAGPRQALETATRFLKEGGAHAVKLEGGARVAPAVETLTAAGIPVVGHLGLTPQSIHALGGYRVQGRDAAGDVLLADALAIEAAGAFAVVLEVVPADLAARVTKELRIATVGIGAGPDCDAQVLVWQDMAGFSGGHTPRFVKRYADLRAALGAAARAYRDEVEGGQYPSLEHSY